MISFKKKNLLGRTEKKRKKTKLGMSSSSGSSGSSSRPDWETFWFSESAEPLFSETIPKFIVGEINENRFKRIVKGKVKDFLLDNPQILDDHELLSQRVMSWFTSRKNELDKFLISFFRKEFPRLKDDLEHFAEDRTEENANSLFETINQVVSEYASFTDPEFALKLVSAWAMYRIENQSEGSLKRGREETTLESTKRIRSEDILPPDDDDDILEILEDVEETSTEEFLVDVEDTSAEEFLVDYETSTVTSAGTAQAVEEVVDEAAEKVVGESGKSRPARMQKSVTACEGVGNFYGFSENEVKEGLKSLEDGVQVRELFQYMKTFDAETSLPLALRDAKFAYLVPRIKLREKNKDVLKKDLDPDFKNFKGWFNDQFREMLVKAGIEGTGNMTMFVNENVRGKHHVIVANRTDGTVLYEVPIFDFPGKCLEDFILWRYYASGWFPKGFDRTSFRECVRKTLVSETPCGLAMETGKGPEELEDLLEFVLVQKLLGITPDVGNMEKVRGFLSDKDAKSPNPPMAKFLLLPKNIWNYDRYKKILFKAPLKQTQAVAMGQEEVVPTMLERKKPLRKRPCIKIGNFYNFRIEDVESALKDLRDMYSVSYFCEYVYKYNKETSDPLFSVECKLLFLLPRVKLRGGKTDVLQEDYPLEFDGRVPSLEDLGDLDKFRGWFDDKFRALLNANEVGDGNASLDFTNISLFINETENGKQHVIVFDKEKSEILHDIPVFWFQGKCLEDYILSAVYLHSATETLYPLLENKTRRCIRNTLMNEKPVCANEDIIDRDEYENFLGSEESDFDDDEPKYYRTDRKLKVALLLKLLGMEPDPTLLEQVREILKEYDDKHDMNLFSKQFEKNVFTAERYKMIVFGQPEPGQTPVRAESSDAAKKQDPRKKEDRKKFLTIRDNHKKMKEFVSGLEDPSELVNVFKKMVLESEDGVVAYNNGITNMFLKEAPVNILCLLSRWIDGERKSYGLLEFSKLKSLGLEDYRLEKIDDKIFIVSGSTSVQVVGFPGSGEKRELSWYKMWLKDKKRNGLFLEAIKDPSAIGKAYETARVMGESLPLDDEDVSDEEAPNIEAFFKSFPVNFPEKSLTFDDVWKKLQEECFEFLIEGETYYKVNDADKTIDVPVYLKNTPTAVVVFKIQSIDVEKWKASTTELDFLTNLHTDENPDTIVVQEEQESSSSSSRKVDEDDEDEVNDPDKSGQVGVYDRGVFGDALKRFSIGKDDGNVTFTVEDFRDDFWKSEIKTTSKKSLAKRYRYDFKTAGQNSRVMYYITFIPDVEKELDEFRYNKRLPGFSNQECFDYAGSLDFRIVSFLYVCMTRVIARSLTKTDPKADFNKIIVQDLSGDYGYMYVPNLYSFNRESIGYDLTTLLRSPYSVEDNEEEIVEIDTGDEDDAGKSEFYDPGHGNVDDAEIFGEDSFVKTYRVENSEQSLMIAAEEVDPGRILTVYVGDIVYENNPVEEEFIVEIVPKSMFMRVDDLKGATWVPKDSKFANAKLRLLFLEETGSIVVAMVATKLLTPNENVLFTYDGYESPMFLSSSGFNYYRNIALNRITGEQLKPKTMSVFDVPISKAQQRAQQGTENVKFVDDNVRKPPMRRDIKELIQRRRPTLIKDDLDPSYRYNFSTTENEKRRVMEKIKFAQNRPEKKYKSDPEVMYLQKFILYKRKDADSWYPALTEEDKNVVDSFLNKIELEVDWPIDIAGIIDDLSMQIVLNPDNSIDHVQEPLGLTDVAKKAIFFYFPELRDAIVVKKEMEMEKTDKKGKTVVVLVQDEVFSNLEAFIDKYENDFRFKEYLVEKILPNPLSFSINFDVLPPNPSISREHEIATLEEAKDLVARFSSLRAGIRDQSNNPFLFLLLNDVDTNPPTLEIFENSFFEGGKITLKTERLPNESIAAVEVMCEFPNEVVTIRKPLSKVDTSTMSLLEKEQRLLDERYDNYNRQFLEKFNCIVKYFDESGMKRRMFQGNLGDFFKTRFTYSDVEKYRKEALGQKDSKGLKENLSRITNVPIDYLFPPAEDTVQESVVEKPVLSKQKRRAAPTLIESTGPVGPAGPAGPAWSARDKMFCFL